MVSLDHIALIVSSMNSLLFYEKLGFKETNRFERNYDTVVFMECNGIVLEIFVDSNHPERISNPEAKGLRHIAFAVENTDTALNDAQEKGIKLIDKQSRGGAEGLKIGFLHPKSTLGVLTELCCK